MDSKKIVLIFSSVVITLLIVFVGGAFLLLSPSSEGLTKNATQQSNNQIIEMKAKFGFTPTNSLVVANKPITLRVNTSGTYDCSSGINIPKLGISKLLPSDGSTDISLPAQASGTTIDGTCSMGMYKFQIKVS